VECPEFAAVDVVPPVHQQMLMVLAVADRFNGFSWRCTYKYSLVNHDQPSTHFPVVPKTDEIHMVLPISSSP